MSRGSRGNYLNPKGFADVVCPHMARQLYRPISRFKALNPHGILDFTIESDGFNAYIDAIGAHMSYWTSPTFSTFVLSQLFLRQDENRGQTSIGDEMPSVVPELKAGEDKELKDEGEKEETDGKEKERKQKNVFVVHTSHAYFAS